MRTTFIAVFLVAFLLVAFGTYGWHSLNRPLDAEGSAVKVTIPRGSSVRRIEQLLVEQRVLGPRVPWVWWARITGQDTRIRSGTYSLSASSTPVQLLGTLVSGETLSIAVTLPEGLTQQQTLERLGDGLGLPIEELAAAAREQARRLHGGSRGLLNVEGYLFPETYRFDYDTPAAVVIKRLVDSTLEYFGQAERVRARTLGLSIHEVLTLASIIEAETAIDEERPRVSAVYHNRLSRGMLLQADPTVAYATGRIGQPLWHQHLEVDSPYNTYLVSGLPPGPINSPGRRCIEAALFPLENCEDLYFVARGDGSHTFSRTLREHEIAKRRARGER